MSRSQSPTRFIENTVRTNIKQGNNHTQHSFAVAFRVHVEKVPSPRVSGGVCLQAASRSPPLRTLVVKECVIRWPSRIQTIYEFRESQPERGTGYAPEHGPNPGTPILPTARTGTGTSQIRTLQTNPYQNTRIACISSGADAARIHSFR